MNGLWTLEWVILKKCVRPRASVYYCSTYYKLFAWGEGDSLSGGHVLRETMSRGLSGLVCPSGGVPSSSSSSSSSSSRLGVLPVTSGLVTVTRAYYLAKRFYADTRCVCVLLLQDLLQSCSRGGGEGELRPVRNPVL